LIEGTALNNLDKAQSASLYPCGRELLSFPEPLKLVVLGATGSIGRQTLEIVRENPNRFQVVALSCHGRVLELEHELTLLAAACPDSPTPLVAVTDAAARITASGMTGLSKYLLGHGPAALVEAVEAPDEVHVVVNGVVGAAGLEPTLAAARRGVRIALANKESLVVGGDLVRREILAHGAEILPVDSEHSAMAQCLSGRTESELHRLILTASGGPFRLTNAADLANVTLEEVLNHPTWNMGPKITVDSATLMNKGLEIIEAHHLFGVPYDRIDVLVHPGSYVHSFVEFVDGALLAQLGTPDMKLPIQYAINGEKHWPLSGGRLDLLQVGSLSFEKPDYERFPCLGLARQAGLAGGSATITLNGANEVAVAALLEHKIRYSDIPRIIEEVLSTESVGTVDSLPDALEFDSLARQAAEAVVARLA
jgi:1-deoxy-D-xylulose-5-phosphate reductoisomerase